MWINIISLIKIPKTNIAHNSYLSARNSKILIASSKHLLTDKIASYNQSLSKWKQGPLLQARKHKGKMGKSPHQEYLPSLFPLLRLSSLKYQKSEEVELPEIVIYIFNGRIQKIVLRGRFTYYKKCLYLMLVKICLRGDMENYSHSAVTVDQWKEWNRQLIPCTELCLIYLLPLNASISLALVLFKGFIRLDPKSVVLVLCYATNELLIICCYNGTRKSLCGLKLYTTWSQIILFHKFNSEFKEKIDFSRLFT